MRILVVRVTSEPNPIKGSAKIKCEFCKLDCWIAPSSMHGIVPFQQVRIVCACCAEMCNCCDIEGDEFD